MGPVNPKTGFSYEAPTANTDGSPLARADIAKFQVGLGQQAGNYTVIKDDLTLEAARQLTPFSLIGTLAFGQWYAAVRAVSRSGQESAWSTEAAFELRAPVPEAPANFSIA